MAAAACRHLLFDMLLTSWLKHSAHAAGTVLAATISASDGGGYASTGSAAIITTLRQAGIFARPLGNVVYLMVTPTTSRATCSWLLRELTAAVQALEQQSQQPQAAHAS